MGKGSTIPSIISSLLLHKPDCTSGTMMTNRKRHPGRHHPGRWETCDHGQVPAKMCLGYLEKTRTHGGLYGTHDSSSGMGWCRWKEKAAKEGGPSVKGGGMKLVTTQTSLRPPQCRQPSRICPHRSHEPPFSSLHQAPRDHRHRPQDPKACQRRDAPVQMG